MKLTTKLKALVGLGVLAMAAMMVFNVNSNSIDIRPGADDKYLLSSQWKPGVLSPDRPVIISVYVDGHPIIRAKPVHLSPWKETMTAEQGASVKLVVSTGHFAVELLDCIILKNGDTVPHGGYDSRTDAGTVNCIA